MPAATPATSADEARVTSVRVDDEGIHAATDAEVVLDVLFDERRIWSFHLPRDGEEQGDGYVVPWPSPLRRFLNGHTHLQVAEHVAPLLDSIEEVLGALKQAGVDAFPAYGTLLGAVRGGRLIGHDSDADLGYVSRHTHPVDVVRESFDLQRALSEAGYVISRYSGAAFKVDVTEGDGSIRGLDVFGGFLRDGWLHLMGEIRTPFREDWIFPLGTTTLEGRTLPAPANTDEFLVATYGPTWLVPDPAYVFETPDSTHRRLNGWFLSLIHISEPTRPY